MLPASLMLPLSLLMPLLVAVALTTASAVPTALPLRTALRLAAPAAALPGVGLAASGDETVLEAPWLLMGTTFAMDALARPLVLVTSLLYGAALLAVSWRAENRSGRGAGRSGPSEGSLSTTSLIVFLLLCFSGNLGTYLAADTVSFYLMFALMSFSAVGLVIHHRTREAVRATRVYLVMSVLSETALLAALVLVTAAGGRMLADAPGAVAGSGQAPLIMGLLFLGFGIKAGTVPMHVWLPLAHPAAPPAASAVLSGAMVKAGLIGWLRFLPEGEHTGAGLTLLTLALLGAFLAVAAGVLQSDPKVILAYSTISQMGFITALVAVGLLDPELAPASATAAVLYAVHHGFAKGALFLGVPVIRAFGRGISGMFAVAGMLVAGASLVGAPWTSGAMAKYVGKEAVQDASVPGLDALGLGVDSLLPLVATGSVLLLVRCAWVLGTGNREAGSSPDAQLLAWGLLVVAAVLIPWWVGAYWSAVSMPTWDAATLWDAVWPLVLGAALIAGGWFLHRRRPVARRFADSPAPRLPAGDLVVLEETAVRRSVLGLRTAVDRLQGTSARQAGRWARFWQAVATSSRRLAASSERQLDGWERSGVALLLILTGAVAVVGLALMGGWS